MAANGDLLEWGIATRTREGERASGDLSLVRPVGQGVLVAVVDGLGHGEEAAAAARTAVWVLERGNGTAVVDLLKDCHAALRGRRGVVMSIAYIDGPQSSLTWVGVGNVEGLLVPADREGRPRRTSLITRGGIVGGAALPPVRPWVIPIHPGDVLVFATDGLRNEFGDTVMNDSRARPQQLADTLLARHGKETDDALVLVARYVGDPVGQL